MNEQLNEQLNGQLNGQPNGELAPLGRLQVGLNMSNFLLVTGETPDGDPGDMPAAGGQSAPHLRRSRCAWHTHRGLRGTFANVRLKNQRAPDTEASATRHLPDGEAMDIYAAGMRYQSEGVSLVVLARKEYGTGSSRDRAARDRNLALSVFYGGDSGSSPSTRASSIWRSTFGGSR